ncbi:FtsX-like permease family protein [Enterococcus saccharolyticus]|uniref:FtsX-like permease family protein n=1 Tax=Enterococcus saccharolyticus TaxID=41997 RepID=UPI0039E1DEDF
MNFSQFVVRNTLRNKHLYLAYFLSTLFSVMVFFTFSVMAFHPSLSENLSDKVQTGMLGSAIIIYGFAFFFVMYSMGVFLQSRKKEFGLLMIQGMSPKQLRKMVFIENLVIGFFATILGSLVGIGFSQIILWVSRVTLGIDFGFYFPMKALGLTIVSFFILFFLISFFIQFRLPKLNVQELLKAGELGKGSFKVSPIKSILALLLIAGGYAVALLTPGMGVVVVFLPVVFVVILGTNFLFNQFSVFVIEKIKKRESVFWKKTNMVVFSDLAFRMKDNARSFFLVSVISTVAFAAIGTLYGFQSIILGAIGSAPYSYSATDDEANTMQKVDESLAKEKLTAEKATFVYYTAEDYEFITESEYNKAAKLVGEAPITVKEDAVQLKSSTPFDATQAQATVKIDNTEYQVSDLVETKAMSVFLPTFVVPDSQEGMPQATQMTYWVTTGDKEAQIRAGQSLEEQGLYNVQSIEYMKDSIIKSYAPVLFVGIFIGIVFFVSAGSFLYFRLYSDMDSDIEKFKMIYKLGLSKKELKKMIYQQVGILFFTPIIVSFVHGAVALTAMYHMFSLGMQLAGWQVLGVFLLIQFIYYLVARIFYFRKVYKGVTV